MKQRRKGVKSLVATLAVVFVVMGAYAWLNLFPSAPPPREPGIVLFRYNQFSGSTEKREQGFLDTLATEFPEINVLASKQYLGTSRETSTQRAKMLMERYGDAVQGVFCVNEPNSDSMLQVFEELKISGKVPFVACDSNIPLAEALKRGKVAGIVLQDPVGMGYTAVNTMRDHLDDKEVNLKIKTGQTVATPENIDSEEILSLLYPERFSGEEFKPESTRYTIAVVAKEHTHEYWEFVRAGAEKAAREASDIKIRFEANVLDQDLDGQIAIMRKLIADGVDGICLAPIDSKKLIPVVIEAKAEGIPTVVFDSDLSDDGLYEGGAAKVSYVATDNYEVGVLAARRLAEVVKAK